MLFYDGTLTIKDKQRIYSALGLDPGRFNFAWAYYTRQRGLVFSSIIEGIDVASYLMVFRKQFKQVMRAYKPHCVCIERYHSQPGRGSKRNLELVNLSIGIVLDYCIDRHIPVELTTAATHKAWAARNFQVALKKDPGRKKVKQKYDLHSYKEWRHLETEHEVDAANMAKFVLEKVLAVP